MKAKILALLDSVRFWQITISALSAYLADVANNSFSLPKILMYLSGWLAAIAAVGTVDKFGTSIKGSQNDK